MYDRALVPKMVMGALLIAVGLLPGIFQSVKDGLQRIAESFLGFPSRAPYQSQFEQSLREPWIAVMGFVFIALNLLAHFWSR